MPLSLEKEGEMDSLEEARKILYLLPSDPEVKTAFTLEAVGLALIEVAEQMRTMARVLETLVNIEGTRR